MAEDLDPRAVRAAVLRPGGRWTTVDVVATTGSTNADLAAAARDGRARPGAVLVADHQSAGRGRLDRGWDSPPGAGLLVSALVVTPGVPAARLSWLPLLAGLSLAEAVAAATAGAVEPSLKWPNDLLAADRKVAGVLVERVETPAGGAAVVGTGTNVSTGAAELPPGATSLALEGAVPPRAELLRHWLAALAGWLERWEAAGGDPAASGLAAACSARSATLGRDVRAVVPGRDPVEGRALRLDPDGRLVVGTAAGEVTLGAGDVVHLR